MEINELRVPIVNTGTVDINIKGVSFGLVSTDVPNPSTEAGGLYYSLCYMLEGNGRATINGKKYILTKNTLYLGFPNHEVTIERDLSTPYVVAWLPFTGTKAEYYANRMGLTKEKPVLALEENEKLINIFKTAPFICNEDKENNDVHALVAFYSIVQAVCSMREAKQYYRPNKKFTKEEHVEEAIRYMEKNYTNPDLGLKMLADHLYITPKHFSALFKTVTNTTFSNYLLGIRLSAAEDLMQQGETSVSDIARRAGFGSAMYFAIVYRKHCNMSPTEHIRTIAAKNSPPAEEK